MGTFTPAYTWLSMGDAITALRGRLANSTFWDAGQLQMYIVEALRTWQAYTEQVKTDFQFTPSATQTWNNTGAMSGSPRLRTVTDDYLCRQMQAMLLEPQSGVSGWNGTTQFSLADLEGALQKQRDQLIQLTACNVIYMPSLPAVPGQTRVYLPDTVLEPQRIRWIPNNTGVTPAQPVVTLTREDSQAFAYFETGWRQAAGAPQSWSMVSEPMLAFDVDSAPQQAGIYDMIALQSGPAFAPPASSLIGVPDDWTPLVLWGALADLLGRESEATDRARAGYAQKRYSDGLAAMRQSNWLVQASISNVPVDTPSLAEFDDYSNGWEGDTTQWPTVVQAGIDMLGVTSATAGQMVTATLVANAPVPTGPSGLIQLGRDQFDVVLDYAHWLACFVMGGQAFETALPLYQGFMAAAAQVNKRLLTYGPFADILNTQGERQSILVPRG